MSRRRYGYRNWPATFQRHNGNVDSVGNPTYSNPADWQDVAPGFYVLGELLETAGGETVRGRQVTATATNVLICEYFDAIDLLPTDRMLIDGNTYQIVALGDPHGTNQEMWIEAKRETGQ